MRILAILAVLALPGPALAQGADDEKLLKLMEEGVQKAADRAAPCVVAIKVDREAEKAPAAGNPMVTGGVFQKRPSDAPTSGTIMDAGGYILTSYFNVSGKVRSITVVLHDGEEKEAAIVGYHAGADLALLKIDADGLPTLKTSPMN